MASSSVCWKTSIVDVATDLRSAIPESHNKNVAISTGTSLPPQKHRTVWTITVKLDTAYGTGVTVDDSGFSNMEWPELIRNAREFRGAAAEIEATRRLLVSNEKLSGDLINLTGKLVGLTRWLIGFTVALIALAIVGVVRPGH